MLSSVCITYLGVCLLLYSPRCVGNKLNPPAGQWTAGLLQGLLQSCSEAAEAPGCQMCPSACWAAFIPSAQGFPFSQGGMLGCLERWILRSEGGVMGSNAESLGKAHQASPLLCCWVTAAGFQASFPGQGFAKSASCASAALLDKCSLWHPSCPPSLQCDPGYCHCLVALSTNFCTSALPWAVDFLQQKLGDVALLSCLGGFSRRFRLAEGARWGQGED